MTEPRRFAVPVEQLDGVRVSEAEQVQEVAEARVEPAGGLVHPFGDGMADADGD